MSHLRINISMIPLSQKDLQCNCIITLVGGEYLDQLKFALSSGKITIILKEDLVYFITRVPNKK